MAWKPTYDSRNRANIAKLADNTKAAALKWYDYLIDNKIDLLIYETIRTEAQQRANVAKGASQTMKSYHLVGQALDFVPVNGKTTLWNGYGSANVKKAVAYAKKLGFEWGGDWSGFVDKPHLQFNYRGYGTDTFGKKVNNSTSKPSAPAPKKSTSYPLPDGVIKVTKPLTKGTKVTQVQTALAACYFYPDKGAKNNGIDGYYGPKTANAVKRFQLMNGLAADGIYGPKTKAKLAAKLK
ncbi:N-acetylmuramoyl-L-alanine amidase CwlH [Bacillus subtilis]|nr:peptidoglycan-binding protein [Bacillus subtilis]MEC2264954.1 peptidoglycan-binding protein [Bacillus subtilis]QAW54897.1 M15 family peptidase [Bacillus subtilis]CAF1861240.1 N-acetylmuramoyl-L-alanine amidase CwlH [Bacillus subtilis]